MAESARRLALGSLATSSRKAYEGAWKKFKALARIKGFSPLPCDPKNFAEILSAYAEDEKKFHSVQQMLAAVTFFHRLEGFPSPRESPEFRLVLRGIKRLCFVKPKRAKPLDSDSIKKVVTFLLGDDLECDSYYDASVRKWRTAAVFVFSFAALCRFNDLTTMNIRNVVFEDNRAILFIPKSKTDQFGEGQYVSVSASGEPSCPVAFIKAYVARLLWEAALEGSIYDGPLFPALCRRRVSGPLGSCWSALPISPAPFSYQGALKDFRDALVGAGLDGKAFSLHSGRRGGATEAVKNGCDLLTLKRQGRWRSDSCPQLYVDDVLNRSSRFNSCLRI